MACHAPKALIGPSILNSDLSCLADEVARMLDSGADYLHLDVMDGHFVPNLTFGHPVVKCLRARSPSAFFNMHMMVSDPALWVTPMWDAGANMYTFHYEASGDNTTDIIRSVKEVGMKVGLAVKPLTTVEAIIPFIDSVDSILVMTVEPGFGKQKFMSDMMPKIELLRRRFPILDIEVDGGISLETIEMAAKAGANMIVSGSALMKSEQPGVDMETMRNAVKHVYATMEN